MQQLDLSVGYAQMVGQNQLTTIRSIVINVGQSVNINRFAHLHILKRLHNFLHFTVTIFHRSAVISNI